VGHSGPTSFNNNPLHISGENGYWRGNILPTGYGPDAPPSSLGTDPIDNDQENGGDKSVGQRDNSIEGTSTDTVADEFLVVRNTTQMCRLYSADGSLVEVEMESLLRGNWHLTRGNGFARVMGAGVGGQSLPGSENQLTFYRRNLFSVVGSVSLSALPTTLVPLGTDAQSDDPDGTDAASDNDNDLTSTSPPAGQWSSTSHAPTTQDPSQRSVQGIESLSLDIEVFSSSQKRKNVRLIDRSGLACAPFQLVDVSGVHEWSKVRFSAATVNNGAPNSQPYFQVVVNLVARTVYGTSVPVARTVSRPIVVRGRHPRFYRDRFAALISLDGADREALASHAGNPRGRNSTSSTGSDYGAQTLPHWNEDMEISSNTNRYEYFPLEVAEQAVDPVYNPHYQHQSLRDLGSSADKRGPDFYRPLESL
jgi:hypothetical protein